ncbi:16S rRNA (guanine(966)-N(2))-methyltransferase RsmD [Mycoplasma sp. 4044]
MLRIVAGKYRNTRLEQPDKKITRASSEKLREALFSSLSFELEDKIFLDLFAGSGAFGFEAISRGVKKSILIEKNREAYKVIAKNAEKFKKIEFELKNTDALIFLQKTEQKFDFIFIDPPYANQTLYTESLRLISERDLLTENGKIILETAREDFSTPLFEITKVKKYSISWVYFLEKR